MTRNREQASDGRGGEVRVAGALCRRLACANSRAAALAGALLLSFAAGASAATEPFPVSDAARKLDRALDWSQVRLLAVQEGNRYKTLESLARESIATMYGQESFPGLSPLTSMFEWAFNAQAYLDTPLVRVREAGLRVHFSAHMNEAARQRILAGKRLTPRELFDPVVLQRMAELEPRFDTRSAMNRVRHAEAICKQIRRFIRIVPGPSAEKSAEWYAPDELKANAAIAFVHRENPDMQQLSQIVQQFGSPIPAFRDPQAAALVVGVWQQLQDGWRAGDVRAVQAALDRMADVLPRMAGADVYPTAAQRAAEVRYYAMGKFAWGYWLYLVGAVFGVFAMVTRWRIPWWLCGLLMLAALGVHTYGIALRWNILGRIPNANMFEAVTFAAWAAILTGFVLSLAYRSPLLLLASHVTGFVALIVAHFALVGGGNITAIMGILDDVMLRIHTTVITISYVLVFLAGVVATVYLFGYYLARHPARSFEAALMLSLGGALILVASNPGLLPSIVYAVDPATSAFHLTPQAGITFWILTAAGLIGLVLLATGLRNAHALPLTVALTTTLVFGTLASLPHGAVKMTGAVLAGGGLAWALATGAATLIRPRFVTATARGGGGGSARLAPTERPLMAGALPGDERTVENLPAWLSDCDWMHLILLNLIFVMLFVGTILGAVWADYSWGRPWGWDPKEVFAMNTWIVYVILIHIRQVVKRRGLWTAWLSVLGTAMMAFNWWVVNHYIVGLHSYA